MLDLELRELELDARYTILKSKVVVFLKQLYWNERDFLHSVDLNIWQGTCREDLNLLSDDLLNDFYRRDKN